MKSVAAIFLLKLGFGNGEAVENTYEIQAICSQVCCVSQILNFNDFKLMRNFHATSSIDDISICSREQYLQWTNLARKFMSYIGLNETYFGCLRWEYSEQPRNSNSPMLPEVVEGNPSRTRKNFDFKEKVELKNLSGVSRTCYLKMGREILQRDFRRDTSTSSLVSS